VNVSQCGAAQRLAHVLLAALVALVVRVGVGRAALPVPHERLSIAATAATAQLRVELLDERRPGLRQPSQLHVAERGKDEGLSKEAVVLDRLRFSGVLVQPLREQVPQSATRAAGPALRNLAPQPVAEADGVPLGLRAAGEVHVLARERVGAAEHADLVRLAPLADAAGPAGGCRWPRWRMPLAPLADAAKVL